MNNIQNFLIAIVLVIIVLVSVYAIANSGVDTGRDAVDNFSSRTEKDDSGEFSFTSYSSSTKSGTIEKGETDWQVSHRELFFF